SGPHGPPVVQGPGLGPADIDHRLDGDAEALLYLEPSLGRPVVRHLRVLVHRPADAVADVIPDDREALRLDPLLDGRADVAEALAHVRRADSAAEGLVGDADERFGVRRHRAERYGDR